VHKNDLTAVFSCIRNYGMFSNGRRAGLVWMKILKTLFLQPRLLLNIYSARWFINKIRRPHPTFIFD
jgi:hypothetical protein